MQVFIAQEETKFGLDENEIAEIFKEKKQGNFCNINLKGYMAMASFVDNEKQISNEFKTLINISKKHKIDNCILSFGMSQDYKLAIQEGSNMVRIGSLLFGARK